MRFLLAAVGLCAALLAGHPGLAAQDKPAEGAVGRIAVSAKGEVSFDGAPVTLDALKPKLADLAKRGGVVWYYREAASKNPPKQVFQVLDLIVENRLPISMSTKPDFSDVVMPDGSTKPRSGARRP
jgi:hypothetical protein